MATILFQQSLRCNDRYLASLLDLNLNPLFNVILEWRDESNGNEYESATSGLDGTDWMFKILVVRSLFAIPPSTSVGWGEISISNAAGNLIYARRDKAFEDCAPRENEIFSILSKRKKARVFASFEFSAMNGANFFRVRFENETFVCSRWKRFAIHHPAIHK